VDPVTIAVVGALGVGKSTVIRKGAKQFGLSDFTVLSAPPGMLGVQTPLRCASIWSFLFDCGLNNHNNEQMFVVSDKSLTSRFSER
jgi:hypothetical protein